MRTVSLFGDAVLFFVTKPLLQIGDYMTDAIWAIVLKLTLAMSADAEATLLFAGDAMMHQAQIDAAKVERGVYDYTACFEPVQSMIEAADYAVVNLETPLGSSNYSGYPCFNAPVSYATALRDAGFDFFLTANNHTLDRRDRGLKYTLQALDSLQISHIGSYVNAKARAESVPVVKDIKGFKIGFLNYTYGTNGISIQGDAVVDYINRQKISSDIKTTREAGAELLVVAMHWGEEYVLLPVKSQKQLADFLISEGVDMVIGGHPHVVQPYEMRVNPQTGRNAVVTYSLGNFISNMKTRDTRGGALAEVKLGRDSLGTAVVKDVKYNLVFTVPPSRRGENYKVYPIDSVPPAWKSHAEAFRKALK